MGNCWSEIKNYVIGTPPIVEPEKRRTAIATEESLTSIGDPISAEDSTEASTATSSRLKKSNNSRSKPNSSMSTFEQECLDAHNRKRSLHGCPPLTLNRAMCKYATEWAENLVRLNMMQHRTDRKYGENIFMAYGQNVSGADPVTAWYDGEIRNYNYSTAAFDGKSGHFTQVVWKSSRQLGVGVARRGETTYVVANYDPPGNFMGQFGENVPRPR